MSHQPDVNLSIPLHFRRGAKRFDERASVDSALRQLQLIDRISPLEDARILDFGCGVKLVQGLHEIGNPQQKYAGVDVYAPMIDFLASAVSPEKYEFGKLNFHNAMYNKHGEPMTGTSRLSIRDEQYSIITMLSVVTHMIPDDALAALQILRGYARVDAKLLFSAFIDPDQKQDFTDKVLDSPLLNAYYRREFLETLIVQADWKIASFHDKIQGTIQHHFVCTPA